MCTTEMNNILLFPDVAAVKLWVSDAMYYCLFPTGPGCSSVGVGAFSENGPFRPNGEVLVRNGYSWNRGTTEFYSLSHLYS